MTAEIFMKKSRDENIDLDAKEEDGMTAPHFVCQKGHPEIAEIIMQTSGESNIDLLKAKQVFIWPVKMVTPSPK